MTPEQREYFIRLGQTGAGTVHSTDAGINADRPRFFQASPQEQERMLAEAAFNNAGQRVYKKVLAHLAAGRHLEARDLLLRKGALIRSAGSDPDHRDYGPGKAKVGTPPERLKAGTRQVADKLWSGMGNQSDRWKRMDRDFATGDEFQTGGNRRPTQFSPATIRYLDKMGVAGRAQLGIRGEQWQESYPGVNAAQVPPPARIRPHS